ncbi:MAG: hypothetical protein ACPLRN_00585 [Microgenomates group bacterium]
MLKAQVAFYLGEQKPTGYSQVIFQNNFFLAIEIPDGLDSSSGYQIIDNIKKKLKEIKSLVEFENFIIEIVKENNLPASCAIASGYLKNNILYLKTFGQGKVFIRRKNQFGLLIDKDSSASGEVEVGDFFIFLTDNFLNLIGGEDELKKVFDHLSVSEIIDKITPLLKVKNDQGAVALFVNIVEFQEKEEFPVSVASPSTWKTKVKDLWLVMKSSKKTWTLMTAFFLFVIFIWSVIFGYQRRANKIAQEKIASAKKIINSKLSQAQDIAYLNLNQSLTLISESKDELRKLKNEIGDKRKDLKELEIMINETEKKILKKEEKNYQEFFDLRVDDKNSIGDKVYLDQDSALILDKKRGIIYQLSIEKKSLKKVVFEQIKSAQLISGYQDAIFFYIKNEGVFKVKDNKLTKVIEKDNDWGEIVDMSVYNGNLYLLDRGKDEIWKYLSTSEGFSNKTSYFGQGEALDLSSIASMTIDGSIYLAGGQSVFRYTSGVKDDFKINLPEKNNDFVKIFTNKDLEKVYLWDKNQEVIYVLGKTGEYIEQINSSILKKASDFFVFKEKIYLLVGSKIYQIE